MNIRNPDQFLRDTLRTKSIGNVYHKLDSSNYEVMQFTGLTNNGQEWYEGDILENNVIGIKFLGMLMKPDGKQ